ncbi:hypothetical protein Tco_1094599 [Tanacetum coccineum]|uniref:Uncharacterized protein n=1 Tax=Tanacetum coccineum TaxID=301880 RepID=A0ABQ5IFZ7_9ASTR
MNSQTIRDDDNGTNHDGRLFSLYDSLEKVFQVLFSGRDEMCGICEIAFNVRPPIEFLIDPDTSCQNLVNGKTLITRLMHDLNFLRLPKSGNQLQFLIQRVPSGRISNALSIPYKFSALMFSSLSASV